MVVASDMDPVPGVSEGFSFPAVGGAVLLSADASRAGFTAFRFATFPEFAELFQSYVDWQADARRGLAHHGRNILTVEIAESYAARALECAESTARELAAAQALDLGERRPTRRHSVGPGLRRRIGEATRRVRRAGRVASGRPRQRAHGRPGGGARVRGDSRRRARRCSSPRARGSQSRPRFTEHDPSVSGRRAPRREHCQAASVAPARGERRAPHCSGPPARATTAGAGSWPGPRGASPAAAHRKYSRRSADTRACSAPGCATRRN